MNQKTGRHVFVALPKGCDLSEIDMLKLLSEAEIDLSSVEFIGAPSDYPTMESHDALVIPLFDGEVGDSDVEAAALAAARAGSCHIVGVWAPGQTETGIHAEALKFSTAQIPWDANKLKNELGSDCANVFETPEGETADPNEIEPHECE